ncbi:MAG: signal peptide peptidase SppA [Myxococcota bacterium]
MTRRRRIRTAVVVLLVLLALGFIFRGEAEPEVEPGSTLVLRVSGAYAETVEAPLLARLLGEAREPFLDLLSILALAERDDRIETLLVRLGNLEIGWGKTQELRDAIERVGAAGRHTIVLLETNALSANGEYFVASVADEIYAAPGAMTPVMGLSIEAFFLGGLFEKLGIEFDVAKAGRYKGAVESYTRKDFSEAVRENMASILDSFDRQFVSGIAEARGMTIEEVRAAIDTGPVMPKDLVALGMIDGVRHVEEIACDCDEDAKLILGRDYRNIDPASVGFNAVARYAIVYGSGVVLSGSGRRGALSDPVFAADAFGKAFGDAIRADDIDGVILRIDSPGGSAMASEEIWYDVKRARKSGKPIVASFSDVAASGGYYAAVAADGIVSPPGALTGSIGVFALRPIAEPLLAKLGISVETMRRARHADFKFVLERPSKGSQERLQASVLAIYQLFLERVAEGRNLDVARVDQLAEGRVWTGEQAYEIGLVDELGGLHAAVQRVNRMRGIDEDADVLLVPYPQAQTLGEQIAGLLKGGFDPASLWLEALPAPLLELRSWLFDLPFEVPLAVSPAIFKID